MGGREGGREDKGEGGERTRVRRGKERKQERERRGGCTVFIK